MIKEIAEKSKKKFDGRIIFDHLDILSGYLNIQYILSNDKEFNYIIDDPDRFIKEYEKREQSTHPISIMIFDKVLEFIRRESDDILRNPKKYKDPRYLILITMLNGQIDYIYKTIFKAKITPDLFKELLPVGISSKEMDEYLLFESIVLELNEYLEEIIEKEEEKKKLNKK